MKTMKTTMRILSGFVMTLMLVFSTACSSDDDAGDDQGENPITQEPIILDCDYFEQDRTLTPINPGGEIDYIVGCEANVNAKLVVEPGVVIAFEPDASLKVNESASLKMEGTDDSPIILTGVQPEKGLWRGMLIKSTKESNRMKYVTIEYAGSTSASHIGYPAGLQVSMSGDVSIDHCTFQYCKDNGLYWDSDKYISITNSIFTKNDVPVKTVGENQIKLYDNTNTYTGNVNDYVHLQYPGISYDNKEITMHKIDVPYYVTTRTYNRYDVNHAKLIIEPGVEIIMATTETKLRIRNDASIQAIGTEDEPIIFRGENGVQADWGYIFIMSGSALNEIAYANIKNAGKSMADVNAALQIKDNSYLNLHDVIFDNNAGYAIGMLYAAGAPYPIIDYANLIVDNNKIFCSGANGSELTDPNDPNS